MANGHQELPAVGGPCLGACEGEEGTLGAGAYVSFGAPELIQLESLPAYVGQGQLLHLDHQNQLEPGERGADGQHKSWLRSPVLRCDLHRGPSLGAALPSALHSETRSMFKRAPLHTSQELCSLSNFSFGFQPPLSMQNHFIEKAVDPSSGCCSCYALLPATKPTSDCHASMS